MNQRMAFFRFQEFGDIRRAYFQLQSGRYPIECLHALACEVLRVLVQVNESGCNDQPIGLDDTVPVERVGRNADNLSVADADIAHRIQSGFGVHDSSPCEYKIVLLRGHKDGRDRH